MPRNNPIFALCAAFYSLAPLALMAQQAPGKGGEKPQTPPPAGGSAKGDAKSPPAAPGKTAASPQTPTPALPTQKELLAKAAQMLKDNKPNEAAKLYRQAIVLYPNAYEPYDRLARIEVELKGYDEAALAARKATELNTANEQELMQEYYILASALTELGRYDEAKSAAERSVELAPREPDYRFLLGDIAMRAKDYAAAETEYLNALGVAPDSYRAHAGLGDVYEQLGRHQSALQEYQAASRAADGDSQANADIKQQLLLSQATALAGLKRNDEAEKLARSVLAKSPDNPALHSALGQVLDSTGKHDEAISEYKIALAKTPGDAILWGNLGWAQYNAEKYDDAIQSSRKALEIDPKQSYVRFNLGLIYAVRNQWRESQKEYDAAIAGAAEADIRAGIGDLQDASEKKPDVVAIRQAIQLLTTADRKSLGFSE
jgi:tetratricopeptide (TPR) repeat protein